MGRRVSWAEGFHGQEVAARQKLEKEAQADGKPLKIACNSVIGWQNCTKNDILL